MEYAIQMASAFAASLGFALLFHVRREKLLLAGLGGMLAWGVYLLAGMASDQDVVRYFLASVVLTVYAELLARVETVLRRYHKTEKLITIGNVRVDTQSRVVTRAGQPVSLTAKEYSLLMLFLQNQNIALFRETIYERVWECDYMGDSRTVDVHIKRLREKLPGCEKYGWEIHTVWRVGYKFDYKPA